MKNYFLILSFSLLFASCESLDGNLEVKQTIKLNKRWGIVKTFKTGNYKAKIKIRSENNIRLSINDYAFTFVIPEGEGLPETNGKIDLTSVDVEQPYDIRGSVSTNSYRGEVVETSESCSEMRPYTVCHLDDIMSERCWTEFREIYGWRDIAYYFRTTKKKLRIKLFTPGSHYTDAVFTGKNKVVRKIYEYKGFCDVGY